LEDHWSSNLTKLEKKEKKKPTNLVQTREGINNKPPKLKILQMPLSIALK